jgi:hypothetical protein
LFRKNSKSSAGRGGAVEEGCCAFDATEAREQNTMARHDVQTLDRPMSSSDDVCVAPALNGKPVAVDGTIARSDSINNA